MSGSVFLNNLDDFIAPSQACINPMVNGTSSTTTSSNTAHSTTAGGVSINRKKHGRVTLETDLSTSDFNDMSFTEPDLIKPKLSTSTGADMKKVATVSLNDCLACSGCVTSAEAVLIQEQSSEKLTKLLEQNSTQGHYIVVQISPNSRSSIAEFLGMSSVDFFLRVAALLKKLGVHYVLDSAAGNDVALIESREEFLHRLKSGRSKKWDKPDTTTALSSSALTKYPANVQEEVGDPCLGESLPVLTSHCPGWVCYAEKTSPQAIPYMSTVKSAQQIVGTVIKNVLLNETVKKDMESAMNTDESLLDALNSLTINDFPLDHRLSAKDRKVFVVSVQPCYDKKLEASRRDFYHIDTNMNEVDLVLSTTEFWQLIETYAWKWANEVRNAKAETSETSKPVLDFDDAQGIIIHGSKKIRLDAESLETGQQMVMDFNELGGQQVSTEIRKQLVNTSFKHVFQYLDSIEADPVQGSDDIEKLFRCFSEIGTKVLSAAEVNAASGGYTEYLFKYAAEKLFQLNLWNQPMQYKEGRNPDLAEIDIKNYISEDQVANSVITNLKFSRAYGFRNIQSILLKMKRGTCDYDLVEIMACPSGCSNGGGQLKTLSSILPLSSSSSSPAPPRAETPQESKDRIAAVEAQYHAELVFAQPDDNPLVKYLYDEKRLGQPLSNSARHILHTRYHAVPKLETIAPLAAKW